MDVDAEEEARADAELAATHAVDPMMDGAETGGPSSSAGTIRFQKTVSIRVRCNPADRSVIVPAGDRSWREVGWTGVGHRTPVDSALGAYCRFYYPGMVTLPNGDRVAAHKWEQWGLKQHVDGNDQGLGERYRLDGEGDHEKGKWRSECSIRQPQKSSGTPSAILKMHLEAEEYVQGEIDWIMKDPEAWRWICNHWAGSDFQGASDRNRGNRTSKPGMQRFGADGFIGKEQRMEAKTSVKPSFVEVYIEGHKGSDSDNPEVLCDEQATEKLAKYKENVIQRHGPRSLIGGRPHQTLKPYTKLAVGYAMAGGVWVMVPWSTIVFQGRKGQAKRALLAGCREPSKKLNRRKLVDFKRKLVPPNYFVSSPMTQGPPLGDAPEFRPPPNYYSTPTSQGSSCGDAQGSQPPNQIIPSGQASQPQQWMYPTQGPPFGDASQLYGEDEGGKGRDRDDIPWWHATADQGWWCLYLTTCISALLPRAEQLINEWELQFMVMGSFSLQAILFFFSGFRKRYSSRVLSAILWLAYLSANSLAVFVLGRLTLRSDGNRLALFWAPFLLLHLGGQETMTAFSMEDNALWKRHLLSLATQVPTAIYVVRKQEKSFVHRPHFKTLT
ncbi:hypothetical protein U9M48_000628 [Paspalum notatum var. saurae]|uniref:DUF4220 domain-containing protein n=1 Tax=Paspalum notatum var. saurae TaxID=547442 RepID=A0AAQ3PIB7_PASNO